MAIESRVVEEVVVLVVKEASFLGSGRGPVRWAGAGIVSRGGAGRERGRGLIGRLKVELLFDL